MATDNDDLDLNEKLFWNGIDAETGGYLFDPLSTAELAAVAKGKTIEKKQAEGDNLAELKYRSGNKNNGPYGVKEGIDPAKLEETGWGVIFPAVAAGSDEEREQNAIYDALKPLLDLRRSQAGKIKEQYYKEYRGPLGYRPGESKQKYLGRLGASPGPADPEHVPYFLLIVGSPQVIPYHVQFQIDVQYAVGRLHFDTVEEYANYARSVVAVETGAHRLAREIAFVGVANPDDPATQLSRKNLIAPLADLVGTWKDVPGWNVGRYFDAQADKATVAQLLGGPKTPALFFSASHGMGFKKGDPLQLRHQGALLLGDWAGPREHKGPITDNLYFSGDDIGSDASLLGMIAFNFACYGAGTPELDEFSKQAFKERKPIADRAFVAGLHRKLLGHPRGGALATIGHVERAWGYSFMWGTGKKGAQEAQLAVFESTLKSLMKGMPVGVAVEYFNERYAEMASDLSRQVEELEYDPEAIDEYSLASMWTSSNDARGYSVIGDPAVRLPLAAPDGSDAQKREPLKIEIVSVKAEVPQQAAGLESLSFGFFGGKDKPKADEEESAAPAAEEKPGVIRSFVDKVVSTLGRVIDDATTLEVRTYVSSDARAAAGTDRETLAKTGDLRAFTRIRIDGDMDVIVPENDGVVDTQLWSLHVELVKQAQQNRAELLKAVLSSLSSLTGIKV